MPLPNFFIIGAAKAGTTALYHAVRQHPDVYMSPAKEPFYFASDGRPPTSTGPPGGAFRHSRVWRSHEYLALFEGVNGEHAIGEASTVYLFSATAASRIRRNVPGAKLVALLREPAYRAYSHYWFMVNLGIERAPTFEEALALEEERLQAGWWPGVAYSANSLYHAQLSVYFDLFQRDQMRVYLYEDWRASPGAVLADLFAFLEVDPGFEPVLAERNRSRAPRHADLHRLALSGRVPGLRRLDERFNSTALPPMRPETHRRLAERYRDDIGRLETLIGRDLSHWRDETPSTAAS